MKELKVYNLRADFFDYVLEYYSDIVVTTDNFSSYENGGSIFKNSIIFDGIKKLVIREKLLFSLTQERNERNNWIQCICYKKNKQTNEVQDGISGGYAWRIMKSKICKAGNYTDEEFEYQLDLFRSKFDPEKVQYHYTLNFDLEEETIYRYKNCRKFDINGSYAKALTFIFPEAAHIIEDLYYDRKNHPENKDLINYFVGMFCVKGYRETFNWIVQYVRQYVEEKIAETDGILLYANTDGFVIADAKNEIKTSSVLGDFKLVYEGDVFIFLGTNYWIIQAGADITGSCLYEARRYIDLRDGRSVRYDRLRLTNSYTAKNIIPLCHLEFREGFEYGKKEIY